MGGYLGGLPMGGYLGGLPMGGYLGVASSPGPTQKLRKGPGHTCRMCYVSLRLEQMNHVPPLPITKFNLDT